MANKKSPLGRALDGIKTLLGIKPKESLERIANAAAADPETQSRVVVTKAARVATQREIKDAKEIDALIKAALDLKKEGEFLLLALNQNNNSAELDNKYYAFNKSVGNLVKQIENKQNVNTLPNLGYTNMQNVIPNLAELDYIKSKIILQMYELINMKNNPSLNKEELPPRNLSVEPIEYLSGTISSRVKTTSNDFSNLQFNEEKRDNDDHKTLDDVLTEFNRYISNINDTDTLVNRTELLQYGEELKKYAVNFLRTLPENLKSQVEIIIKISERRTTTLGIYTSEIEKENEDLKNKLQTSLKIQNLSTTESEQLQKGLTAILLWQDSNKGIETFKKKYTEIIQYKPFIPNPHKDHPD